MFPPELDLKPKSGSQWSHTHPKDKNEQGLKLYNIEPSHFVDFRYEFHKGLSSTAHGNENTIHMFTRTPEENRPKLEADLTVSIAHLQVVLESALKCYIQLYLGRNADYRKIRELCEIKQA